MICISIIGSVFVYMFVGAAGNTVDDLFQNYWEFLVSSQPQWATSQGEHRFNNQLDNYTLAHFVNLERQLLQFQDTAKEFVASTEVDHTSQVNLEFLIEEIEYKLKYLNTKDYFFPVTYLDGPPSTLYELVDVHPMKSKEDFVNLVSRYNAFPTQVEEIIELMREGIRMNMTSHERSFKNYEQEIEDLISVSPENSTFYQPFHVISSFVLPEETLHYSEMAANSISESLNPGLKALSDFIKNEYRPHMRSNTASSSLPNGSNYYSDMLRFYVTDDVTPQMIHDVGLNEVERISEEMAEVMRSHGFREDMNQFNVMIRSNASMYFETQDNALNAYVDLIHDEIEPRLPLIFKKIPKTELGIKRVPEQRSGGPIAYYLQAIATNNSAKGFFYLDTSDLHKLPKHLTVTLALHEAKPGHHFQTCYKSEIENLPIFRKRSQYPLYAAFSEGWALYSEFLGKEMGLYNDTYMLYGYLSQEMFRACRLVVDTGIHALGWSRNQAIDFMQNHTVYSRATIADEVDRYITWPGQACAYKHGEIKLKECRSKAERSLGNKFDIKDFHDVILNNSGSLNFVKKQVDRYISSVQE